MPAVVSCLIAIVACAAVGFISGLIIVHFHVNSFIATLGMSQVIVAATLYISANKQITGVFSTSFLDSGRRRLWHPDRRLLPRPSPSCCGTCSR